MTLALKGVWPAGRQQASRCFKGDLLGCHQAIEAIKVESRVGLVTIFLKTGHPFIQSGIIPGCGTSALVKPSDEKGNDSDTANHKPTCWRAIVPEHSQQAPH